MGSLPAFFFFSSRRRHTRLVSDWSSDVCSSDLLCRRHNRHRIVCARADDDRHVGKRRLLDGPVELEIGRASCRERVENSVVAVYLKKKENKAQKRHIARKQGGAEVSTRTVQCKM